MSEKNEREAFEAWLVSGYLVGGTFEQHYRLMDLVGKREVECAWKAWQARAALTPHRQMVTDSAKTEREALIAARPYVVGAYECAFPDDERNAEVLAMIDAALSAGEAQQGQPMQLPESMSRDEMLSYYSQYANVQANEALRYQKRIRDLQAKLSTGMVADSAGGVEPMGVMAMLRLHNEIQRDLAAPAPSASPAALTAGSREKLIELANELDGELNSGANWTKAQHTCCSVSGELRALAAQPPAAAEAEKQPIGYMNERMLSILASGMTACTTVSHKKTEYAQVAIYTEAK